MKTRLLRAKCTLFAGAAVLLSLATAPALAQGYPSGSYARSCTNIQSYGGQVTADCRRMDGSWDRTTLNGAHRCAGGIANTDGRLTCNNGRHVGSSEYDQRQGLRLQGCGKGIPARRNLPIKIFRRKESVNRK